MTPTPRQKQIIEKIASGLPYKRIAAEMGISEHGVARHVERIKAALPVESIADITRWALANGLARNEFEKGSSK